jgi:uncharacterized protein
LLERERALRALRDAGCSDQVIQHCLAVEHMALKIAKKIRKNDYDIDLKSVSIGALLHDIGRAKTHGVEHGVVGAEMLRKMGLRKFARFAENHIGAGISAAEARKLGLPEKDFMPRTLEEKVVTYADKRISRKREISCEEAVQWFKTEFGNDHPSVGRFEALHSEIQKLMD